MIVTTLEGYAVKALIYIARKESKMATIKEISTDNRISFPYILRICSSLRKQGVLKSTKGRKGGYTLERDPKTISLYEIINAVGRTSIEIKCDFGMRTNLFCYQKNCISLDAWEYVLEQTNELYKKIKLSDLIERSNYENSTNTGC